MKVKVLIATAVAAAAILVPVTSTVQGHLLDMDALLHRRPGRRVDPHLGQRLPRPRHLRAVPRHRPPAGERGRAAVPPPQLLRRDERRRELRDPRGGERRAQLQVPLPALGVAARAGSDATGRANARPVAVLSAHRKADEVRESRPGGRPPGGVAVQRPVQGRAEERRSPGRVSAGVGWILDETGCDHLDEARARKRRRARHALVKDAPQRVESVDGVASPPEISSGAM